MEPSQNEDPSSISLRSPENPSTPTTDDDSLPNHSVTRPAVTELEQRAYTNGVRAARVTPPVDYPCFSLCSALLEDYHDLDDHTSPAFPANVKLAQKLSVRFLVRLLAHDGIEMAASLTRRSCHGSSKDMTNTLIRRMF